MPYWKLYYHFIWGTKKRSPLIDLAIEPELYRAIASKAKAMGGFVYAIGGTEEHVHLGVSLPPNQFVARLYFLKGMKCYK